MTMQRMEKFIYCDEVYDLAAIEKSSSFHLPKMLRRIPFREPDTSLHRGFISTFSLDSKLRLVLHSFRAWVQSTADLPLIRGISPVFADELRNTASNAPCVKVDDNERDEFIQAIIDMLFTGDTGKYDVLSASSDTFSYPRAIEYKEIDIPIHYSGRLIIGKNAPPYFAGGYKPPFLYETAVELTFSEGLLCKVQDVSEEAERIKSSISAQREEVKDPERHIIAIPAYSLSEYDLELTDKWTDKVYFKEILMRPTILLIDVSALSDENLRCFNDRFSEVLEKLDSYKYDCRFAVMEIGNCCRWLADGGKLLSHQFVYASHRFQRSGHPDYEGAFDLLERSLLCEQFMFGQRKKQPMTQLSVILLSSGKPTGNWRGTLKRLNENCWFSTANKFAAGLQANSNTDLLSAFVGASTSVDPFYRKGVGIFSEDLSSLLSRYSVCSDFTRIASEALETESVRFPLPPEVVFEFKDSDRQSKEEITLDWPDDLV